MPSRRSRCGGALQTPRPQLLRSDPLEAVLARAARAAVAPEGVAAAPSSGDATASRRGYPGAVSLATGVGSGVAVSRPRTTLRMTSPLFPFRSPRSPPRQQLPWLRLPLQESVALGPRPAVKRRPCHHLSRPREVDQCRCCHRVKSATTKTRTSYLERDDRQWLTRCFPMVSQRLRLSPTTSGARRTRKPQP